MGCSTSKSENITVLPKGASPQKAPDDYRKKNQYPIPVVLPPSRSTSQIEEGAKNKNVPEITIEEPIEIKKNDEIEENHQVANLINLEDEKEEIIVSKRTFSVENVEIEETQNTSEFNSKHDEDINSKDEEISNDIHNIESKNNEEIQDKSSHEEEIKTFEEDNDQNEPITINTSKEEEEIIQPSEPTLVTSEETFDYQTTTEKENEEILGESITSRSITEIDIEQESVKPPEEESSNLIEDVIAEHQEETKPESKPEIEDDVSESVENTSSEALKSSSEEQIIETESKEESVEEIIEHKINKAEKEEIQETPQDKEDIQEKISEEIESESKEEIKDHEETKTSEIISGEDIKSTDEEQIVEEIEDSDSKVPEIANGHVEEEKEIKENGFDDKSETEEISEQIIIKNINETPKDESEIVKKIDNENNPVNNGIPVHN